MVACLEKTEGNSNFHEIVDFLASSSIHHALTVVVVTEASIRSSLLFNDADGTACLTNEAIFSKPCIDGSKSTSWNEFSINIASAVICLATNQKFNFSKLIFDGMLRNLDNTKKKFLMYPRILMMFLNNQIELGEPFNDVYPTPAHNLKVFTNMSRKGLKFLGKITPLFPNMLTHAAEGEGSGEPTEHQPTPSPSHATTQDSRDSLEETNGNEGNQVQIPHDSPLSGGHTSDKAEGALNLQELSVLCTNLSNRVLALESIKDAQAAEISALKIRIKRLEKKCKPSISHHRAWLKSVQRLSMKKRFRKKESVSKQGRKKSKPESTLDDSTVFDDQDADHGMEYMETEEAVDEGRQSGETEEVKLTDDTEVVEDKGSGDKGGNAKELVSTARPEVSTARQEDSDVELRTPPTTTSIFDNEDITMAQTLIKIKEEKAKEKGVSIKDVDDSSRHERSILTLKLLPTIDPKDKGKGVLKESPVKEVKRSNLDAAQIAKDAKIARLIHEKELAEMEREREERQRHDQASVDYIASLYDEVQAKMDASEELAARLQMEERERCKYRHNQLNKKTFEEIQALYIKEQERDADFVPIGSERDEKMIDKMNKKAAGMDEEEVPEEPDSTKVKVKQEGTKKRKLGTRKKMKSRKRRYRQGTSKGDKTDSDIEKENDELRLCLTIISNKDKEVDYEILDKKYPIIEWKSEYHGIKPQFDETKDFLNPFTADSLLKTIWFSTHHASHALCYSNEALAIPEQTATGKEISNPFMAGEDCWVLEDFTTYCCWFNIGAASEDLVLLRKIEENSLRIDKFVFPVDFIVLDMPEDIKTPLILGRPFLSTTHAKIDVLKRKITLRVGDDKVVFKSDKPTSNIIKRVYALSLREIVELDLEARLMGEALILNRSLVPLYGDYIELNDLNEPLELRRNQVDDLKPTIEEGEVVDDPMMDIVKTRYFIVVENMDSYRDKGIGDIIVGRPFCKDVCIKARRFDGMITIYKGNDSVTYQMA
ncbi:putative ribonuclease H-like domain-containing protein [Tanacetum coccineum]